MTGTLETIEDVRSSSLVGPIGASARKLQVILEVTEDLDDQYVTHSIDLPASSTPTPIEIRAVADASRARRGASNTYLASIRRKTAKKIEALFRKLDVSRKPASIMLQTAPILDELQLLIGRIQPSEREANSREILRQVRETLMNGQWVHYANSPAKIACATVMKKLSEATEISFDDTTEVADKLESLGFSVSGLAIPSHVEDE